MKRTRLDDLPDNVRAALLDFIPLWDSALRWFDNWPVAAFGGKTCAQMCRENQTKAVVLYLRAASDGAYA